MPKKPKTDDLLYPPMQLPERRRIMAETHGGYWYEVCRRYEATIRAACVETERRVRREWRGT